MEKNCGVKSDDAAIRIKARHQAIQILPDEFYRKLIEFVRSNYCALVRYLEPRSGVKTKGDVADCLVRIMHNQGLATQFLTDIVASEIEALNDAHCVFRGNSLGSKSVEAYMKLVASKYLNDCLADIVRNLIESGEDCEVDPAKLAPEMTLKKQQLALKEIVEMTWSRIINSQR